MRILAQGKFVAGLHPVFKTKGLKMVGREHFDALGPMAIAHDLMEHFEDDDGTPEHELLAIGASWFVRDHGRYLEAKGFPKFSSLIEHLAANLQNVKGELDGLNRPLRLWSDQLWSDQWLYVAPAEIREVLQPVSILPGARPWLVHGYHRARERYSPLSAQRVCEIFAATERAIETFLKFVTVGTECEVIVADTYQRISIVASPSAEPKLTPRETGSTADGTTVP